MPRSTRSAVRPQRWPEPSHLYAALPLTYVLKSCFHREFKQLRKLLGKLSIDEFPFISLRCRGMSSASGLGEDLPDLGTLLPDQPQRWELLGVPGASPPGPAPASGSSHGARESLGISTTFPRSQNPSPRGFGFIRLKKIPTKIRIFVVLFTLQKLLIFMESKGARAL